LRHFQIAVDQGSDLLHVGRHLLGGDRLEEKGAFLFSGSLPSARSAHKPQIDSGLCNPFSVNFLFFEH
jgi:hypothetical protein